MSGSEIESAAEDERRAAVQALRPFFVINPKSASGAAGRRWRTWERAAEEILGPFEAAFTAGPEDATALTRQALSRGHRLICAVGGDGTLNEVVNGFFDEEGGRLSEEAVLGHLPCGTGGDFRRTARIPVRWEEACRHLLDAPVRAIDLGLVTFRDHAGAEARRHFINVASCGVSGEVVEAVNLSSKRLGGWVFKLATAMAFLRYRDQEVRVSIDGGPAQSQAITALAMANGRYFGGGMMVAPEARVDDGLLSCTRWAGYRLQDFIFRQRGIHNGEHIRWSGTQTFSARSVRVESDARVLVELDGELPGTLPATFEVRPHFLSFKG